MTNNMLKLNQGKTELIVISSKFRPKPAISYVSVGDEQIVPKSSARNLGVIFDECCSMVEHVNKICKTSYYHLRNISKIRKYLTEETTEIFVHAFVSSKLDYCNSLLYGLPKHMISSLQSVQNTAARVVTVTKKFDHITPVLIQLHWLPVHFRILFKVLLLVYKALNGMAPLYITELLSYRTVHVHVRYALLIKNFWQFRGQDLKHTETGPFPLLHLNSGTSCLYIRNT